MSRRCMRCREHFPWFPKFLCGHCSFATYYFPPKGHPIKHRRALTRCELPSRSSWGAHRAPVQREYPREGKLRPRRPTNAIAGKTARRPFQIRRTFADKNHVRTDIMTDIIRAVQHLDAAASLIPAGGPAWGQMPRRDTYATLNREVRRRDTYAQSYSPPAFAPRQYPPG
jgi:hypothetical protein